MKTLENALVKIKENPDKYISGKSMERLNLFILGYVLSQSNEEGICSEWRKRFQEYVQQKYKIKECIGYSGIIRCFSTSDAHAFDIFYELLDEFYQNVSFK